MNSQDNNKNSNQGNHSSLEKDLQNHIILQGKLHISYETGSRGILFQISLENKIYSGTLEEYILKMGFGLDSFDEPNKKSSKDENKTESTQMQAEEEPVTASRENAEMYTYYEQLIRQMTEKYPLAGDRLALALIMTRADKPTLTKNRELSLVDVDKMISIKNKSFKSGDQRIQNMRMAVDLSGLKNNNTNRDATAPSLVREPENNANRGNFQIFRLVRAAQLHYFQATRRIQRENQDLDLVNTSFTHETE